MRRTRSRHARTSVVSGQTTPNRNGLVTDLDTSPPRLPKQALIADSATHNRSPSRLESVRPPGGAEFIAYERLEEVEGASVEWRGGSLVVFCEVRLAGVDKELGAGGHAD